MRIRIFIIVTLFHILSCAQKSNPESEASAPDATSTGTTEPADATVKNQINFTFGYEAKDISDENVKVSIPDGLFGAYGQGNGTVTEYENSSLNFASALATYGVNFIPDSDSTMNGSYSVTLRIPSSEISDINNVVILIDVLNLDSTDIEDSYILQNSDLTISESSGVYEILFLLSEQNVRFVLAELNSGETAPNTYTQYPPPVTETLAISNVTDDSATITWSTVGQATSYIVCFFAGTTSFSQDGCTDADFQDNALSTDTTYNFTGLTPETDYVVAVVSVNAGGNSNGKKIGFQSGAASGPSTFNFLMEDATSLRLVTWTEGGSPSFQLVVNAIPIHSDLTIDQNGKIHAVLWNNSDIRYDYYNNVSGPLSAMAQADVMAVVNSDSFALNFRPNDNSLELLSGAPTEASYQVLSGAWDPNPVSWTSITHPGTPDMYDSSLKQSRMVNSRYWAAWSSEYNSAVNSSLRYSYYNGTSWATALELNVDAVANGCLTAGPEALAMASDYSMRLIYFCTVVGPTTQIVYATGGTPTLNLGTGSTIGSISLDVASDDSVHIVYQSNAKDLVYRSSSDNFVGSTAIYTGSGGETVRNIRVVQGNSGKVRVFYLLESAGTDYILTREFNGSAWSGPETIHSSATNSLTIRSAKVLVR